ncbi:MAG: flagellar biosynthesis protein FlhF [Campylobacterales bacterium]|nr:flagellar biosynthesis protein FlhF [Campylobacterales bacterium]
MKLLSFQGETPAAALKKAQERCGEDALVINTKLIQQKTLTSPSVYEVIVAIENDHKPQSQMQKEYKPTPAAQAMQQKESKSDKEDVVFAISSVAKQMTEINKLSEATKSVSTPLKKETIETIDDEPKPVNFEEIKNIKTEITKLVDNVKLIQNMVWDTTEVMRDGLVIPPEFAEIYKISKDSGMSDEHLFEIMKLTLEHMQPKMRESSATVRRYFNVLLRKLLPIRHEMKANSAAKKIIMLVGPTGVGKTTTLAKLAARYAFKQDVKYKVGIITLDTYRIGAVEQLMQYAKMMKLSIEAVVDPSEFKTALSSLRGCDYILIDTVGSSHYDKKKINKISNFIKAESSLSIDISLVLSATTKYEDLKEIYNNFASELDIDTLIVTKMDETKCFGNMFSLLYDIKKPVSYFSTGQEVPEDLITASSEFFVDCLLDGYKVKHAK